MHTLNQHSIHGKNLRFYTSVITCALILLLFFSFSPSFAATITYEYDALNRLHTVNYGNGFLETYAYDGVGNRTSLDITDVVPPTGTITSNQIILANGNATLSGTANDLGSGVEKVEISFDGGQTWQTATGTTNWSYTWPTQAGTYTVSVRVTDNEGNTQITSQTITVAGEHNPDILWRNTTTGDVAIWYLNNGTISSGVVIASGVDTAWTIVGTDDFNGDD